MTFVLSRVSVDVVLKNSLPLLLCKVNQYHVITLCSVLHVLCVNNIIGEDTNMIVA